MLALLLGLALQAADGGSDWPRFLGPSQDGSSPETGLLRSWPAAGPREAWSLPLGSGFAAPCVAGGRCFVFDREGGNARLRAVDAATGKELWRFAYPTDFDGDSPGPRASPVSDGERVYVFGAEGKLHALKAADGAVVWSRDTAKDFGVVANFFGAGSTPLVEGGLVIAMIGGSPPGSPEVNSGETKGNGSGLVAFDAKTGETRWKSSDELASYASPVLSGRRGFVLARGGLLAFDPASGAVDFHFPWRSPMILSVNAASPVVAGDLVFVSEAYSVGSAVLKLKPGGYDVAWQDGRKRDRAMSCWWATPVHADGHLYGSSGQDPELRCVEMATGKVLWSKDGLGQTSLLRADGRFVALSDDGTLRLLRLTPERFEQISEASLVRGPARAAPVLARGRLYVRGSDRLACLEVADDHPIPAGKRAAIAKALGDVIAEQNATLEKEPKSVDAFSRRGDAHFFLGRFAEAAADYDKMAELDPALETQHWRRGIAWFYAGRYDKAARQFEIYHTFDDVDRENGIWRFLSQAKASGLEKAREGLLKYAKDDREPFPAVYALFAGKTTGEAVLKGIADAKISDADREARIFYASLYVGLDAAVRGEPEKARVHLRRATASPWPADAGYGPRYMWHVGRLHYESLK